MRFSPTNKIAFDRVGLIFALEIGEIALNEEWRKWESTRDAYHTKLPAANVYYHLYLIGQISIVTLISRPRYSGYPLKSPCLNPSHTAPRHLAEF